MLKFLRHLFSIVILFVAPVMAQSLVSGVVIADFDALTEPEKVVVCTNLIERAVQVQVALQQNIAWRESTQVNVRELIAAIADAERVLAEPGSSTGSTLINVGVLAASTAAVIVGMSPLGTLALGAAIVVVQYGGIIYLGSSDAFEVTAPALSLVSTATLVGFGMAFPQASLFLELLALVQIGLLDAPPVMTALDRSVTAERLARHRQALAAAESALVTEEERGAYMTAQLSAMRDAFNGSCGQYGLRLPAQLR